MNETDLDGATTPGERNTFPSNAGEFAARWNSRTTESREEFTHTLVTQSGTTYRCVEGAHVERIAYLEEELARAIVGKEESDAQRHARIDEVAAFEVDEDMPVAVDPASARLAHAFLDQLRKHPAIFPDFETSAIRFEWTTATAHTTITIGADGRGESWVFKMPERPDAAPAIPTTEEKP